VGDWAVATYWGTGARLKTFVVRGSDQWAARTGSVAPGLWQLDVVQKYGYEVPDFVDQPQVVGVVAAYDSVIEHGWGPLLPGFK
jgi:hypothetical protein